MPRHLAAYKITDSHLLWELNSNFLFVFCSCLLLSFMFLFIYSFFACFWFAKAAAGIQNYCLAHLLWELDHDRVYLVCLFVFLFLWQGLFVFAFVCFFGSCFCLYFFFCLFLICQISRHTKLLPLTFFESSTMTRGILFVYWFVFSLCLHLSFMFFCFCFCCCFFFDLPKQPPAYKITASHLLWELNHDIGNLVCLFVFLFLWQSLFVFCFFLSCFCLFNFLLPVFELPKQPPAYKIAASHLLWELNHDRRNFVCLLVCL